MVECTGFENRKGRKALGGSNPPASVVFFFIIFLERWQSGRMRALGERVIARSQGSNPCLSVLLFVVRRSPAIYTHQKYHNLY